MRSSKQRLNALQSDPLPGRVHRKDPRGSEKLPMRASGKTSLTHTICSAPDVVVFCLRGPQ